jgi:protein-disulfide isomerase
MNKSFWIILGVAILGLVGIFIISGGKASNNTSGEFAFTEPYTNQQSHDNTTGAGNKVTIVEYADFQCPYCASYAPLLDQVKAQYGDDVKVIFRHFPIPTSHPQSMAAHRAAQAASKQGKFWEMHDKLFTNQQTWSGNSSAATIFETYAEEMGLNMDQFKTDVASDNVLEKINSDTDSGRSLGVNATPTFFINGQKVDTPPASMEEWDAIINGSGATEQSQNQ